MPLQASFGKVETKLTHPSRLEVHTMTVLCPKCGGDTLQRSRRRLFEYPLSLFHIWPFRCKHCNARLLKYSKVSFK